MKLTDTRTQKFHPLCDVETYSGAELCAKYVAGWIAQRDDDGHIAYDATNELVYIRRDGSRTSPSNAFVIGYFDRQKSYRWAKEPTGEMELSADEYLADL